MPVSMIKNDEFLDLLKCSQSNRGREDIYVSELRVINAVI